MTTSADSLDDWLRQSDPAKVTAMYELLKAEQSKRQEKRKLELSLSDFVRAAWSSVDSSDYQSSWAIDALCEHLQAVNTGDIPRLLVNFPPRCGKTIVTSICWPAYTWAQRDVSFLSGAPTKFLCGSYSNVLALQNSNMTRRLMMSPWYQERWGKTFALLEDQNAKAQFDNSRGGSRIATSVGGSLLGIGGDIICVDDPHNTAQVESEAERETVAQWWRELRSTRLNDPKQSAIVVIMQRLHQEDVSGMILEGEDADDWTHLCLPMEHDPQRHCVTVLKTDPEIIWEDPRTEAGELMWPERFGAAEVRSLERGLGAYMASGRLQQLPTPKGGGIFKRDWWRLYPTEGEAFTREGKPLKPLVYPVMDYVVASVDTAYTAKEENDFSAMTVWGSWRNAPTMRSIGISADVRRLAGAGQYESTDFSGPKVMLMDAWNERLEFRPLVERILRTCQELKVDRLLIEAKASGISVAQEIGRLMRGGDFTVSLVDPRGDKVARAYAVTNLFEAGLIYAPDRKWSDLLVDQMETFPKGAHDDLVDSAVAALKHLRDIGVALLADESDADLRRRHGVKSARPVALPYAV